MGSPSEKDTAAATLEKRLWDAADQFRSNSARYVGVVPGEDISNEDFKEQFETLNEELETLNTQARELETTIAKNVVDILAS